MCFATNYILYYTTSLRNRILCTRLSFVWGAHDRVGTRLSYHMLIALLKTVSKCGEESGAASFYWPGFGMGVGRFCLAMTVVGID